MLRFRQIFSIFAFIIFGCLIGQVMGADLVKSGKAEAYILLGSKPSWQDRFAAKELSEYIKKITDAALPINRFGSADKPSSISMLPVLVGSRGTHEIIDKLTKAGKITLNESELTSDGFIIKMTEWEGQPCLVIAGVSDVATVYAAYDFLERFGRVGFFRYEEHVPKRGSFSIESCDIKERPYFRVRMHGGQYHYFGIQWFSEEQWKQDLRWYAKYRLNRHNYLPGPPVLDLAEAGMWKRLGIDAAAASDPRDRNPGQALQIVKRLARYALKLGVRSPYPTSTGEIPTKVLDKFQRKYPRARYFEIVRNDSKNTYVHPADPMWLRLNQARLENMIESFGDSKLYYLPSPWAERAPGKTPEQKEQFTREYAAAVGRLARWAEKKHPGAEWTMDGWAFANKKYWQPYRVKRMLDSLPENLNFVMWDYPAEEEPSYVYNSYWFDRPWAFIVLNSMAGNTTVHGDVQRLIGNVFRVLCDQRAEKMIGFGYYTEARDYIPFFKDLVLHMAWNPMISLDDFVRDYCERRYDERSVSAMVACHEKMLKTVYGPQSDTHMTDGFRTVRLQDPAYWFTLGGPWVPFDELQRRVLDQRRHWGPILLDALADALSVAELERDNPAYVRDLADLMRSYVHVRINQAIWDAVEAMRRGDTDAFERHYADVERLFDYLLKAISLVAHRWEFGVNALVRDFQDAPLKFSPKEIRHYLYYVTFGGNRIHDYFRSDRYEMIRDIYRPKTMTYLDTCREYLKKGGGKLPSPKTGVAKYATIMDATALAVRKATSSKYQPIIDKFIEGPCTAPPASPSPAMVAKDFLAAARQGKI